MNRIILNETSYFGAGCRSVIAVEAARRGFKKAFFVTDKDLVKFGVAAEIIKVFDDNKILLLPMYRMVWLHIKLPVLILSWHWVVVLLLIRQKVLVL